MIQPNLPARSEEENPRESSLSSSPFANIAATQPTKFSSSSLNSQLKAEPNTTISSSSSSSSPSVDRLTLDRSDSAFVMGRNFSCKKKIAKAAGCAIDFNETNGILTFIGTDTQRKRALKYVKLIISQKNGPVTVNPLENLDNDLTTIECPEETIGYCTGKNGNTMRKFEEEWNVLIFFCQKEEELQNRPIPVRQVAIFGEERARIGAKLKIMSASEQKLPGFFTKGITNHFSDLEFGTDTLNLTDISYVLGRGGVTRRKIVRASNCIIEIIGSTAFLCGTLNERKRGREYISWLIEQLKTPIHLLDNEGLFEKNRDDLTIVDVPMNCIGYVTGNLGSSLRSIEEETGTYCFFDGIGGDKKLSDHQQQQQQQQQQKSTTSSEVPSNSNSNSNMKLLIFGAFLNGRLKAKELFEELINHKLHPHSSSRKSRSRSKSHSRPHSHSHHHHKSHSHSHSHHHHSNHHSHRHHSSSSRSRSGSNSRSKSRSPTPEYERMNRIMSSYYPTQIPTQVQFQHQQYPMMLAQIPQQQTFYVPNQMPSSFQQQQLLQPPQHQFYQNVQNFQQQPQPPQQQMPDYHQQTSW